MLFTNTRFFVISFIVFLLIFPVAVSQDTSPPHQVPFDPAKVNIDIIINLFDNSKGQFETMLNYSVNEKVFDAFNESEIANSSISRSISFAQEINGEASSYQYFNKILNSFVHFNGNSSVFVNFHKRFLSDFTNLTNYKNHPENRSGQTGKAVEELLNCTSNLKNMESRIIAMKTNTLEIKSNGFNTTVLEDLLNKLTLLMDNYNNELNSIPKFLSNMIIFMLYDTQKSVYYLGENISIEGCFYAYGNPEPNLKIFIYSDNVSLGASYSDSTGQFRMTLPINLTHPIGLFSLVAQTYYNNQTYWSNTLNLTIEKIPTSLNISVPSFIAPGNDIIVTGTLTDVYGSPLSSQNISVYLSNYPNNEVLTTNNGMYTFRYDTTSMENGIYFIYSEFRPEKYYQDSNSNVMKVTINIPTVLTLSLSKTKIKIGEFIHIFGQLKDSISNSPLPSNIISIYNGNNKICDITTNTNGMYNYSYNTTKLTGGTYLIQSVFTSNIIKWRDSTSNIVKLTVIGNGPGQSSSPETSAYDTRFTLPIIFLVILAIVLVVFQYSKKRKAKSQELSESLMLASSNKSERFEPLPDIKLLELKKLEDALINARNNPDPNVIAILGYVNFLKFLENVNVQIKPSYTHRDIGSILVKKGMSGEYVKSITEIYETAKYTTYALKPEDIDIFMNSINKASKEMFAGDGLGARSK